MPLSSLTAPSTTRRAALVPPPLPAAASTAATATATTAGLGTCCRALDRRVFSESSDAFGFLLRLLGSQPYARSPFLGLGVYETELRLASSDLCRLVGGIRGRSKRKVTMWHSCALHAVVPESNGHDACAHHVIIELIRIRTEALRQNKGHQGSEKGSRLVKDGLMWHTTDPHNDTFVFYKPEHLITIWGKTANDSPPFVPFPPPPPSRRRYQTAPYASSSFPPLAGPAPSSNPPCRWRRLLPEVHNPRRGVYRQCTQSARQVRLLPPKTVRGVRFLGDWEACMVTHIARVWINRVRLPILHVVS